jgi:hypothetical protein
MYVEIGERVRALREARGLSQEEVARRTLHFARGRPCARYTC